MQDAGVNMQFFSFAKINIGLRIVAKRPDGFHDIETFFQQIDLHDTLNIEATLDGQIELAADRDCPADQTNLAHRAAALLKSVIRRESLGCRINLKKQIPMGAGLGGGSSNAAAALVALNKLWGASLSAQELADCAARLGSDVPFFLRGGFALGKGRGEILTSLPHVIEYYGVLVYPNIHISTAWAYNNFNLTLTKKNKIATFISFIPHMMDTSLWKKELKNDLASVVFAAYPEFSRILEKFYEHGAFYAQMSGSGSTLFGLFREKSQAGRAASFFKKTYETVQFRPLF